MESKLLVEFDLNFGHYVREEKLFQTTVVITLNLIHTFRFHAQKLIFTYLDNIAAIYSTQLCLKLPTSCNTVITHPTLN
jgi:hypothetical protein